MGRFKNYSRLYRERPIHECVRVCLKILLLTDTILLKRNIFVCKSIFLSGYIIFLSLFFGSIIKFFLIIWFVFCKWFNIIFKWINYIYILLILNKLLFKTKIKLKRINYFMFFIFSCLSQKRRNYFFQLILKWSHSFHWREENFTVATR